MPNTKKKIGIIHYTYPPTVGGVENLIRTHAQLFSENGYKTTIFTSDDAQLDKDVTFVVIPELSSIKRSEPQLFDSLLTSETFPLKIIETSELILAKLIEHKESFDVLIAHNIFSLTLNPAISLALIKFHSLYPTIPIISWMHDLIFKDRETFPQKEIYVNKELDTIINTPLDGVHYVVISEFLKQNLINVLNFPSDKITVIPNGIDINFFLGLHSITKKIVTDHKLFDADCVLFFPSKIMQHKNVEVCLEALYELKKQMKNPLLIFSAKEYPHSSNARAYIEKFTHMVNTLDLSKNILLLQDYFVDKELTDIFRVIRELYVISDIILYPSKYENFGLPIIEAALTKTPIICSNLEVFNEVGDGHVYQVAKDDLSGQNLNDLIVEILNQSKQSSLFMRVKQNYRMDTIFTKKILPYIEML